MACKKCGSDWTTPAGLDCNRCPSCDKQQRCMARKQGRISAEIQKSCCVCGQSFYVSPNKQNAKHCGHEECRKHFNREKRRLYNARKELGLTHQTLKVSRRKTCKREGCANPVKVRKHQYCSKACAGADVRGFRRGCKGRSAEMRKVAALASWFVDSWEPQRRIHRSNYIPRPPCEVCGIECNHRNARCCSYACKRAWRGPRACKCGAIVDNATLYRSPSCNACKRESKRVQRRLYGCYRRRCRTYGGVFNSEVKPAGVFARDGYVCHLCRKKTHRVYRHDDPLSATVDHHPVPLSKGGDHDWHNVRCACKQCNELKGNKWDGQMMFRLRLEMAEGGQNI